MTDTATKLRELVKQHRLTYARIAELAGKGTSIKTVENWMTAPGSRWHQPIPEYRLELIELKLRLEAANGVKV